MSLDLANPIIYLITKGEATPVNFDDASRQILDIVSVAVEEKIPLVQIREKHLTAKLLFELTNKVIKITKGSATRVLVNDRADIASAAGADGVHLTSGSLPTEIIRKTFGTEFIIGVSTHNIDEAETAVAGGADLIVFGPVFDTPDKGAAVGLSALSDVCDKLKQFPVLALGGVDKGNYRSVIYAGAKGFAAIRSLNDIDRLRAIATELRNEN
ncbi:MAG: thiamine phosphate synthase [Chloracidobacterium sp.]|nr:thiamine phosphate synthase [Chloracidobacterium sp.]